MAVEDGTQKAERDRARGEGSGPAAQWENGTGIKTFATGLAGSVGRRCDIISRPLQTQALRS